MDIIDLLLRPFRVPLPLLYPSNVKLGLKLVRPVNGHVPKIVVLGPNGVPGQAFPRRRPASIAASTSWRPDYGTFGF